jgi:hypothetical protein
MDTTASRSKLFVRVGNAEFKAIGPQDLVKEQFDLFLGVVSEIPGAIAAVPRNGSAKPKINGTPKAIDPELPANHHEQFEENLTEIEGIDVPLSNGDVTPLTKEQIDRAYRLDGKSLSMRVLPHTKDPGADGLLLLVYGFHAILDQKEISALILAESARQSGVMLSRIDRTMARMKQFIRRGGRAKGTRYQITNPGIIAAERLLKEMFG